MIIAAIAIGWLVFLGLLVVLCCVGDLYPEGRCAAIVRWLHDS